MALQALLFLKFELGKMGKSQESKRINEYKKIAIDILPIIPEN
jgi:hypothetical protein